MKALTIFQPWASLIMIGAKPVEFRRWDYRTRERALEGQRIVIHASARPIKPAEIADLINRCKANDTSLIADKALPLLLRIMDAHKCRGVVNLSAALGTAILGKPRQVDRLFQTPDSDRIDEHMWAWPLGDVRAFVAPIPMNGAQGFWNCQIKVAA
jgi:hypothetical protein